MPNFFPSDMVIFHSNQLKKLLSDYCQDVDPEQSPAFDEDGFYLTVPSRLSNKVLIDGFFAARLIKND